jgi:membrane-associated phospholipid phosphatase
MDEVINKQIKKSTDFLFGIGYFSEIILALVVIYVLQKNAIDVLFYVFFFLFSGYLNTVLKDYVKQPRPATPKKFLYSENISRSQTVYGMPSGHSQNVFFSLTYLYLTVKDSVYWIQIGLVLAALMVYERWTYHNHTLLQLFVGAVIGVLLGICVIMIHDTIIPTSSKSVDGADHSSSSLILGAK